MSIESVMLSNHLILCHPLLFLVSIFPSISIFSSELALHIRWTKYWRFSFSISPSRASHMAQWYRIHLSMQETWVRSLGQEYPLEKEMANSSSILAWNIPWTEEPGGQGPKESDTTEHSTWSWSWRLLKALSMNSVFFFNSGWVSCSCCNKLLSTPWLKTTHIYDLSVLKLWNPKSVTELKSNDGRAAFLSESGEENLFPCLFQLLEVILIPWLMAASLHHPASASIFTSLTTDSDLPASLVMTWASPG